METAALETQSQDSLPPHDARRYLRTNLAQVRAMLDALAAMDADLERAAGIIQGSLLSGGKVLACGNGGSAADSAHFVAELVGRYVRERRGYGAIDLTADHALLTALVNDYPVERLFARQVEALGKPGDVLVVFSTSGRSPNVVAALRAAQAGRLRSVAFLGRDGGASRGLADVELIVPSSVTARIQEAHQILLHTICEALDDRLPAQG